LENAPAPSARRHGVSRALIYGWRRAVSVPLDDDDAGASQQLFTWRREARKLAETLPAFVPAVIAPEPAVTPAEPTAPL